MKKACDAILTEIYDLSFGTDEQTSGFVVVVCPCRSNAEHMGLLSEVSMVMCVHVVSDQSTDRTSSTQS
jgi:hypothetical protein